MTRRAGARRRVDAAARSADGATHGKLRAATLIGPLLLGACIGQQAEGIRSRDLTEVAGALGRNIEAINRHDVEAYLAQYLASPDLIVVSIDSLRRGYEPFAQARQASSDWPDRLLADGPTLIWVSPGVVWAGFEYRAILGRDTIGGFSERLFVKTPNGWKIAVTGMMERWRR